MTSTTNRQKFGCGICPLYLKGKQPNLKKNAKNQIFNNRHTNS